MKAVLCERNAIPEGLVLRETEKPAPGDNEVLVRIHNASVNALDYRSVQMGILPKRKILGADISGVVEAIGRNVLAFQTGDEVAGDLSDCGFGGFAEYVAVPDRALVRKPKPVAFEAAAALPVAAGTALQALRDKGGIQPGKDVLVVGAGGGVGLYSVQLAKHFRANVTAVCGAHNVETTLALGADRAMDYAKEDFGKESARYDLVLAVNGAYPFSTYKRALRPGGVCVVIGGALRQILKAVLLGSLMSRDGRRIRPLSAKPNPADLELLLSLVEQGRLTPVIDRRYPLEETAQAVDYVRQGHARGKVIISVRQDGSNPESGTHR